MTSLPGASPLPMRTPSPRPVAGSPGQLSLSFATREPGRIKFARLANSPRLQRVLAFLRERGAMGGTTRDIVVGAEVCAVSSCCDELRENGFDVECTREAGDRWRYRLHEPPRPDWRLT